MLDHVNRARALVRRMAPTIVTMALLAGVSGDQTAEAQRGGTLDLDELELSRGERGRQLALHYSLAGRARPDVQLHISVDGARRDQDLVAVLDHPRGWIPLGRIRRASSVTIRATDRRGRLVPMRLGRGLVVTAVELSSDVIVERAVVERHWGGPVRRPGRRVDDPRDRGPVARGSLSVVAAACDRAFINQSKEAECLQVMRGVDRADSIIAACDRAFTGENPTLRCLQQRPEPPIVDACDRAFVGQAESVRCLASRASIRAIAGCDRMFTGDDATLRCVEVVGRTRAHDREVDEAFQVCGRRVGQDAELACLNQVLNDRRARRRRRR